MIVELCGVPGCGKTTVVEELRRKKNISFITRKELLKTQKHTYIDHFLFYFNRTGRSREQLSAILRYARNYDHRTRKYIYKLLEMAEAVEQNEEKDMILDEGVMQLITSVPFDEGIKDGTLDEVKGILTDIILKKYYLVYCDLAPEKASERIVRRGRRDDRYRTAGDDRRVALLKAKKDNLEYVREYMSDRLAGTLILNMEDETESNAEKLYSFVTSKKTMDLRGMISNEV